MSFGFQLLLSRFEILQAFDIGITFRHYIIPIRIERYPTSMAEIAIVVRGFPPHSVASPSRPRTTSAIVLGRSIVANRPIGLPRQFIAKPWQIAYPMPQKLTETITLALLVLVTPSFGSIELLCPEHWITVVPKVVCLSRTIYVISKGLWIQAEEVVLCF